MADTDPAKFKFRFYVVRPFDSLRSDTFIQIDGQAPKTTTVGYDGVLSPFVLSVDRLPVDRIVEMPDGTVLIPTTALARLRNKAQLAFALSVAIQSVLQMLEGTATEILRHGQEHVNTDIPAPVGFIETQQAMRLGMRYMYLAGFDIREAPFAWIDERGQQVSNPVINVTNPDDHFAWYSAYAFTCIRRYYPDVDYSKLKRGEAEYQQFLVELRKADPEAFVDAAKAAK